MKEGAYVNILLTISQSYHSTKILCLVIFVPQEQITVEKNYWIIHYTTLKQGKKEKKRKKKIQQSPTKLDQKLLIKQFCIPLILETIKRKKT